VKKRKSIKSTDSINPEEHEGELNATSSTTHTKKKVHVKQDSIKQTTENTSTESEPSSPSTTHNKDEKPAAPKKSGPPA